MGLGVWDLELGVWAFGSLVWSLGLRVKGLERHRCRDKQSACFAGGILGASVDLFFQLLGVHAIFCCMAETPIY